jgi:hypothetical protein
MWLQDMYFEFQINYCILELHFLRVMCRAVIYIWSYVVRPCQLLGVLLCLSDRTSTCCISKTKQRILMKFRFWEIH